MELSQRLQTVAEAITPGGPMADIGTDHGYLPIYLVETNKVPYAFAMDVSKGSLEKAKTHIKELGLSERIETRLSNGLEKMKPGEVKTVVMAGMGGDLVCRILEAAKWLDSEALSEETRPELVLSPQTEVFKVREWLHAHRYEIVDEWFLEEDGQFYVIMKARPSETAVSPYDKPEDYLYGKCVIEKKYPAAVKYLDWELKKREKVLKKLFELGNQPERVAVVEKEAQTIKDALARMCKN